MTKEEIAAKAAKILADKEHIRKCVEAGICPIHGDAFVGDDDPHCDDNLGCYMICPQGDRYWKNY